MRVPWSQARYRLVGELQPDRLDRVNEDGVDRIRTQWSQERPDLDTEAMGILGRINRTSAASRQAMARTFARHGLTGADFDVLATLRRSGDPFQLAPGALSDALMLTSGGMTSRLDRLEQAGLVERSADPDDRRSRLVTLSDRGRQITDDALDDAVATQLRLVGGLSAARRRQLEDLLRDLLASATNEASPP